MKGISVNIMVVLFSFCMQGCIREDIMPCKDSVLSLRYRYTLNNRYENLFGADVSEIEVYVFDESGRYLGLFSEAGDVLTNDYVMSVPLPEGNYQIVVYGGGLNMFSAGAVGSGADPFGGLVKGVTEIGDFRMMLDNAEGDAGYVVPQAVPDDLFAGYEGNAVSSFDTGKVTDVDLMKNTKNIIVRITGTELFAHVPFAPDIYITSANGRYKFENSIDEAYRIFKYVPFQITTKAGKLEANLRMMRLVIGNRSMITVKNPLTSEPIYNLDMIEKIRLNPKYSSQEDIDREDTFVFDINITDNDHGIIVSLSINGWEINEVVPALN